MPGVQEGGKEKLAVLEMDWYVLLEEEPVAYKVISFSTGRLIRLAVWLELGVLDLPIDGLVVSVESPNLAQYRLQLPAAH